LISGASAVTPNDWSDEDLAEALRARHPAAALTAWRRFLPLVRGVLRRGLVPRDVADDVAQEVFVYFFRGVHQLRDPRALRAFVVTLANRTLASELRRRRRRARLQFEVELRQIDIVGERADPASRHAFWRLCQLLTRLRERDRRVLLMCTVERCEAHEAAEMLGVSVPTIRRSLARARKRVASWRETDPFLNDFAAAGLGAAALP
jgi:RNA polymerase sigma-70 factor, ECF subfamily